MPRRLIASLTAAMLALTMLPAAAAAQMPSGFVAPCFDGGEWTAAPAEPIHFTCGWGIAGGPGRIVSYLTSQRATLIVRDEEENVVLRVDPDELRALYRSPEVFTSDDEYIDCAAPDASVVMWDLWLDDGLAAGTYEVTFVSTLTHPVNDGNHTCWLKEDGSRIASPPSLYRGTSTSVSTLVVAAG